MVLLKNKINYTAELGRGWESRAKKSHIPNSGSTSKDQISYDLVIFVTPLIVLQSTKYFASSSSQAVPDFERSWADK